MWRLSSPKLYKSISVCFQPASYLQLGLVWEENSMIAIRGLTFKWVIFQRNYHSNYVIYWHIFWLNIFNGNNTFKQFRWLFIFLSFRGNCVTLEDFLIFNGSTFHSIFIRLFCSASDEFFLKMSRFFPRSPKFEKDVNITYDLSKLPNKTSGNQEIWTYNFYRKRVLRWFCCNIFCLLWKTFFKLQFQVFFRKLDNSFIQKNEQSDLYWSIVFLSCICIILGIC